MYLFKTNINNYQENKTFLSKSFGAKNDFLKLYNKSYNEKEKSKQLYIQVLCELKVAIFEGNLKNFKNLSNVFSYIVNYEKAEELVSYFQEDIYPFKGTNIIILSCEYNRLEILKHILSNYSTIYKHLFKNEQKLLSPTDQDENLHNAFYYAIRSGNTELAEMLIQKWPGNYFDTHSNELDTILSEAYEELKLKNVILSEAIEIFVEAKLINLRFFSSETTSVQNRKVSLPNITERITLLIEQIKCLPIDSEVNEEFLFILKCIIQNINTLKRLIKITYNKVPWEEIEFCLICFVLSFTQQKEINLYYRAVLGKNKIMKHLINFANGLESIKNEIGTYKINALLTLPKISRRLNVTQIIKRNPEFEELYRDYQKICDIHTLNTISNHVTLASAADVKKREGQLVISRSLQVIGECLKNTLESPKLSSHMSDLLLLSLPKNTRKVIIDLRNSLSHVHSLSKRIEIQQNTKVSFFQGVQNDIKKIGNVINDVLFENKLKTVKNILETIVDCKDLKEVEKIIAIFDIDALDELVPKNLHLSECKKFGDIIEKLKNAMPNKSQEEEKIFKEMDEIINSQNSKSENKSGVYFFGISELSQIKKSLNKRIDQKTHREIKFICNNALTNIVEKTTKPQNLKCLAEMAVRLMTLNEIKMEFSSLQSIEIECNNLETIRLLVLEIICIAEIQMDNVHWVNDLREQLLGNKYIDQYQAKNFMIKDEYMKQLDFKLLDLKSILKNYKLDNLSSIPSVKNNEKLVAALEMLILDILTIIGQLDNRLEDNFFFLDQRIPYLIGKNLRNHLAHYNAVTDILSSDPVTALILNAQIIAEKLEGNLAKIGGYVEEEPAKLKSKINLDLEVINLKKKMFDALEAGDFDALKSCIAKGADIHSRRRDDWTTLHAAAKGGNLVIVKYLVEQKLKIDAKSTDGQNPLHVAAASGSASVVEYFIKQKFYDIEDTDDTEKTPLHLAAMNNQKSTIEVLMRHKADCSAKDSSGHSPVHHPVQQNHLEAVQVLLKNEKSVDANEMRGSFTPLHLAADAGSLDVFNFLISRGANVNATTEGKATALHLASLNGHTEIAKTLVEKESEINARTWDGCTPLMYAAENGSKEIVDILLKNGADPNIYDKTYNSGPIYHAAKDGHVEILKALLRNNADANVRTNHGKSPLDYAVTFGQLEIVKVLHQHGVSMKGSEICSSLHLAVKRGHLNIVEYLIDQKVDVNATDLFGSTPLHYAASEGHDEIARLLIKNNAEVNARNCINDYTPLMAALGRCIKDLEQLPYQLRRMFDRIFLFEVIDSGEIGSSVERYEVVEVLLENGADVNAELASGVGPLHLAAAGGNCAVVNMLLQRNASVNQKCKSGFTPLHVAVMFGQKQVVEILLANKARVNSTGTLKHSALHLAVEFGHKNIVKCLLANNANVNETNKDGMTPAATTVREDRAEILEMLIENGADVQALHENDLAIAILKGSANVLRLLLKHTRVTDNAETMAELLHLAIDRDNVEAVNALLAHGADVNKGKEDKPHLLHAVAKENARMVEILLKSGADVNVATKPKNLTALHVAAMVGSVEVAEILLEHGVDVDTRNSDHSTALHLAALSGHCRLVELLFPLVRMNVNERKGENGVTLLHLAAQSGSVEVVKFLMEKGADPRIRSTIDAKPIHIATKDGHLELLKYFLEEQDMDVGELGAFDRGLLHYAALTNRVEIAEYLVERGADVNARDAYGITPLYVAVDTAGEEFVRKLLEKGAMYNLGDVLDRKPVEVCERDEGVRRILLLADRLFQAVKQNSLAQVTSCIKAGALVNVRNAENVTPLHVAAWKGHDEIVQVLLANKAEASAVGKSGFTPLHYAAKFGHASVCMTLLSNGAIYNAAGESGKTPLDLCEKKEIVDLLKRIDSCFEKVTNKNTKVLADLKKLKDVHEMKTVMCACNREGETLIAAAVLHGFPKVDQLKDVLQNDLNSVLKAANSLCIFEDYDAALAVYRKALEIRTEMLGKNNLGTLDVQSSIAKVLYKQYKYDEALKMYTEVYEQQKTLLGESSKEALKTRSDVALVLHRLGRNDEALEIFEDTLEKQRKILTMDDPDLRGTLNHKAIVLISMNRNEEALQINTKVLEHRRKTLTANDPEILVMQNNIGLVLNNLGRHDEALKTFRKVYEGRKKALGPNHSDTLRAFHNLISVLEAQKMHAEALAAYGELLKTQEEQLGPEHLDTLNTQQSMAMLCMRQGKIITALKIYNRYLPAMRRTVGPSHPNVLSGEKIVEAIKLRFQRGGYPEIVDVINNLNDEARTAASKGDLKALRFLIDNDLGVNDPDAEGRTLLHYACDHGHADVALLLLDSGARANVSSAKGNTPLHIAAHRGREEMAKLLLGRVEPREALVEFVNARTRAGGNTALHAAARAGHRGIARMLLVHGASFDARNGEGRTPLCLARDYKVVEMLEGLRAMFEWARKGDAEVARRMQSAEREMLVVFANARDWQDKTLVQVAIMHKHQVIAKDMLTAVKRLA